jgi:DNA-binding phage protein
MAYRPKVPRKDTPLALRIRAAAKAVGSLEKLREKTGLSTGTFYGLLSGAKAQQNPTKETLQKLVDAGVSVSSLFRTAA